MGRAPGTPPAPDDDDVRPPPPPPGDRFDAGLPDAGGLRDARIPDRPGDSPFADAFGVADFGLPAPVDRLTSR